MEETIDTISEILDELIEADDKTGIEDFCLNNHPAFVAEALAELPPVKAWKVLTHAEARLRAEIFSQLEEEQQVIIISILPRQSIVRLISDMPHDVRADLFKHLPEETQENILPALAQAEREDIRRLTAYSEGTAGAVMTSDYATLSPNLSASEAIEQLRREAPDRETIYYAYVVNEKRQLMGFISLKDLILAPKNRRINDILHEDIIYAQTDEDQESTARKIQKFELIALPVVNEDHVLVGIITYDDALDIITQEHTEDMEKFMAITGTHESEAYMKTGVWGHFKNRVVWVVVLAAIGLLSVYVVEVFEDVLSRFAILAAFIPMLAGLGGNTGSQAASLVIRALALKEVTPSDIFKILSKELRVSMMLGSILCIFIFLRVFLFTSSASLPEAISVLDLAIAVSLALGLQVVSATIIGALLPLISAKLKFDPAVVASPALTTMVDITGLLIYFTTVKLIMGI